MLLLMTEKTAYTIYHLHNQNSATIKNISKEKTNVLVIEMINLFSFEVPPVMLRDKEWIKSFDHIIINNAYEGPVKLIEQQPIESKNQQPVYEFLMAFYNEFKPKTLNYFDNDIDTNRSFLKWCRFNKIKNPPFVAKYYPNIHFSNLLLQSIAKSHGSTNARDFFTNSWPKLLPDQHTKLFWTFNRHKRWGRIFIFYLLQKANLLDKGIVSMHLSHVNSRFISLASQVDLTVSYKDLENLNEALPMEADSGIIVSRDPKDLPTMRNDDILNAAINVCTETHFFENNLFFTEKTLKPLLFRQIVLPVASYGVCHQMTNLYGFKFSPITYKIDSIENPTKRLHEVINALQNYNRSPEMLEQELNEVKANWEHNMRILLDHCDETQHTIITRMINEIITNRV